MAYRDVYKIQRPAWGGVTVKVATARYISLHLGQTYCSCSDGCKQSFEKEPEKSLEKVVTAWMR
jgi:YHS domain-containing protein